MAHANARTNLFARRLMVERVAAGWPAAHVAEQLGVSRATVHKWVRRHAEGGDAGAGRSLVAAAFGCRPGPPTQVEKRVLAARRRRKRGAVVLAAELGLNPSTVGRILARHRRAAPGRDRPDHRRTRPLVAAQREPLRTPHAGRDDPRRRQETRQDPGRRRLAAARPRATVRSHRHKRAKIGYDYVHTAIDDHTRLAYSEIHDDEKDPTSAGFLHRALAWFAAHGITRPPRADRQRHGLSPRHRLGLGLLGLAAQTPLHQTRLPLDQRQSRTVQPHPAHRMGLRPTLDQQQPPPPRP